MQAVFWVKSGGKDRDKSYSIAMITRKNAVRLPGFLTIYLAFKQYLSI